MDSKGYYNGCIVVALGSLVRLDRHGLFRIREETREICCDVVRLRADSVYLFCHKLALNRPYRDCAHGLAVLSTILIVGSGLYCLTFVLRDRYMYLLRPNNKLTNYSLSKPTRALIHRPVPFQSYCSSSRNSFPSFLEPLALFPDLL